MDFQELARLVIEGNAREAEAWVQKALQEGTDPLDLLNKGLIPGMDEVGRRFREGEYFLPEVLISARAMKNCLKHIRPLITERKDASLGVVVLGTVKGDVHDIGKNIVGMMMEGAGFVVHDLGVDVPVQSFVRAVEELRPSIVGLSSLLTTSMPVMRQVIEALESAELRQQVKVMVGGAPVTEDYARRIEADGYAPDAVSAVARARELLGI